MKYCIECGTANVAFIIPEGDNRPRHICHSCDYIHYINPRMICGTLPLHDNKVLLCKRSIEPRKGYWTLPAGFMENGESIEHAAHRETQEEALATAINSHLYSIFSLPKINQVHIFYKCDISNGEFGAGVETEDAQLFSIKDIPWDQIAFKTVYRCLEQYIEDIPLGQFSVKTEEIVTPFKPS